jgi:hypothetical protein
MQIAKLPEVIPSSLKPLRLIGWMVGLFLLEAIILSAFVSLNLAFVSAALVTILLGGTLAFLRRAMYSFDEKGLYKRGRLLLNWADVKSVETVYYNHSFTHTFWVSGIPRGPAAIPVLMGSSGDQLFPTVSSLSYGVALLFHQRTGKPVVVHSNLDRLLERRVLEGMREAVQARRLNVDFPTTTQGNPQVNE